MTAILRSVLRRAGHQLVGSGSLQPGSKRLRQARNYWLHRPQALPADVAATAAGPDGPYTIELAKVTNPVGFSFAPDGWHPYVATLQEYLVDRALPYEASALAQYYATYQPSTVQEALLDEAEERFEPLASWPPLLHLFTHIWALNAARVRWILRHPEQESGACQQFGPQDRAFGELQIDRLLTVYDSMAQHGYRPQDYADDHASGYFLVRGEDYRFVLFHGNHRVPALQLLGVEKILVETHWGHPPVVREDCLAEWTTARGGLFPSCVAHRLFHKLFTETGTDKAHRLGLL